MSLGKYIIISILLCAESVCAYETDPFTDRLVEISDSTQLLNTKVNGALQEIVREWKGPEDQVKFVKKVFHSLGGYHWVDKLERFVMRSDLIEKLPTKRYHSIYSGYPIWASRVTGLMGVGPTFKLHKQLVGSDKIGHFFSQGKKFYLRYLKSKDEKQAARKSAFTERAIFGQKTTGSYSNADLVANYEGHLFYRSLFEDEIIKDKKAIVSWQDNRWVLQRDFNWQDHVNAYWDEGININHYDRWIYPHVKKALLKICSQYDKQPEKFHIQPEVELRLEKKYSHLQLRDSKDLRLSNLCQTQVSL